MATVRISADRVLEVAEGGAPDGIPVVVHHGTPGGAVLDAHWDQVARAHGLRLVAYARPGYGDSTRVPDRQVVDGAADVAALADALGLDRFLSWGASGGGPHVLACAAELPDRVVAAASLASVAPYDADGLDFLAGMGEGNIEEFGLAAQGEQPLRVLLDQAGAEMMGVTEEELAASMAEHLTPADEAEMRGPVAGYLVACFRSGLRNGVDGWVDDDLAFTRPWGFEPAGIGVPTLLVQGRQDRMVPFLHGEWLAARVPGVDARLTQEDGHLSMLTRWMDDVHAWLRAQWDAAGG